MAIFRRLSLPVDLFVILFVVSGVLGVLPAYDRELSYPFLGGIVVSGVLYLAMAYGVRSWDLARYVGITLVVIGTVFAGIFMSQFDYQNYPETPAFIQQIGRITTILPYASSYYMHPNTTATFLVGLVALGAALALSGDSRVWKFALGACTAVMFFAVLMAFSRGAMIALMVTLAVWLATRLSRRLVLLAPLAFFGGFVVLTLIPAQSIPLRDGALAWVASRADVYQNSLYLARDYAFTGIGLGDTFTMVYSRYSLLIQVPFLSYPHNLPLAVWMGQGVIGALAFAGLVVVFYLFVYRTLRSSQPRRVFYGAWMGVTAILLHGLVDARQFVEEWWVMPPLFILMGLAVACGRLSLQNAYWKSREVKLVYFPPALAAAGVVGLVVLGVVFNRPLQAAWHTNMGALYETHASLREKISDEARNALYDQAQESYLAALAIDEHFPNANRRLGNLYANRGNYAEAVPLLEIARAAEPLNPAAIKGLGLAYVWVGMIDQAASTLMTLENPHEVSDELFTWGWYRQGQGQDLLTAYAWDTALTMYPSGENLDVLMAVANAYRLAGQLDRAGYWYAQVLRYDPDHKAASEAFAAVTN